MKKNTISLATAITAALISSAAQADSWNVTQTTTPASDTTITQYGSAQGSAIQSMNAVNSATATVTGSQAVISGAFELELEQKNKQVIQPSPSITSKLKQSVPQAAP